MKVVDLTQTVSESTPVYPGDPRVQVETAGTLAKDGFKDHKITFGSHTGTHIDAPAHMLADGKELKDYPAERFISKAICIDATMGFSLEAIKLADIHPGQGVLFYTGASEYFEDEKYWHEYKVLDEICCRLLVDEKVSMVGLDTGSADSAEDFPVHKALLGADILIVENLTNLKELVGKTFEFSALPIKLEKDGAPVRAIARLT